MTGLWACEMKCSQNGISTFVADKTNEINEYEAYNLGLFRIHAYKAIQSLYFELVTSIYINKYYALKCVERWTLRLYLVLNLQVQWGHGNLGSFPQSNLLCCCKFLRCLYRRPQLHPKILSWPAKCNYILICLFMQQGFGLTLAIIKWITFSKITKLNWSI